MPQAVLAWTAAPSGPPFPAPIPTGRNPNKGGSQMAITVAEKEHWKARIESKIDKKIELIQRGDPELFQTIKTQAKEAALDRLELTAEHKRLPEVQAEIERLEGERRNLFASFKKKACRKQRYGYYSEHEFLEDLEPHVTDEEESLLQQHERGREILKLRVEKENLLDTVWLATSPRQVKELWENVSALLGDDATDIQKEILATDRS